jgi:hypothetical protein
MSKAKTPRKAPNYKKRNLIVKILFFLVVLAIGFVSFGAFVMTLFGALPTFAAWYRDNNPRKSLGYTVGLTNTTCIFLVIKDLLPMGQHLTQAMPYLQNPWYWCMIYIGAVVGYGIHNMTPKIVIKTLRWNFQGKIQDLKRTQNYLVQQWGRDVVGE